MHRAPNGRASSPTIAPPACSNEKVASEPHVRESFAGIPGQWFWTWLTGKPAPGQESRWRHTPWGYLAVTLAGLVGGILLGVTGLALAPGGIVLMPASWILTVHGARVLQVSIIHYAVHGTFSSNERVNTIVGEVLSTLLLISPYPEYKRQHGEEHHGRQLATLNDPDVKFLRILGFEPGAPLASLRRHLRTRPISPTFHWAFLKARLQPNLGAGASGKRRLAAWWVVIAQVAVVCATGVWLEYLILWIVPLTVLYHVSSLWQFTSEHVWLRVDVPGEPRRVTLQRLTSGRFCGEAAPGPDIVGIARRFAWLHWFTRMLLLHLPTRLFVLAGDLSQHDWHHRHAKGSWRNAPYERQRDIDAGRPNYKEVWGPAAAIDRILRFWSELPPQPHRASMSEQEKREQFAAM